MAFDDPAVTGPREGDRPDGERASSTTPVRWGLADAVTGLAVTVVAPGVVVAFVLAVSGREDLDGVALWATALLQVPLWVGLAGAPLWASYLRGRRSLAADFGLRSTWRDVPLGVVVGFGAQLALGLVVQVVYRALEVDLDKVGDAAEELTAEATSAPEVVLLVVAVAVVAPVLEELFYRGLWLAALRRRVGPAGAVVGSALVFAALHLQPYDFLALFGFGLLVGALTVRTGRLGPAIWAHVAFNLVAVVGLLA